MMSLAFNEPVLLKMLRFVEKYGEIYELVEQRGSDHYLQHIHPLVLFMLSFKHNLWVSNLDEFVKSQYFDKQDILMLVRVTKPLMINLIQHAAELEKRKHQAPIIDEFVLMAASQLLLLLHD